MSSTSQRERKKYIYIKKIGEFKRFKHNSKFSGFCFVLYRIQYTIIHGTHTHKYTHKSQ